MGDEILYGDQVRLRHDFTGAWLMSMDHRYSHAGSSLQQFVVCTAKPTQDTLWIVKGPHGYAEDYKKGSPVKDGDKIRLEHASTGRNLHTHSDRTAPITGGQREVTCYELHANGNDQDDWVLIIGNRGTWITEHKFRLRNADTNDLLHSHLGPNNPFTKSYQEVTAAIVNDDNDYWICESGDHVAQRQKFHPTKWIAHNWLASLNVVAALASLSGWTIFTLKDHAPSLLSILLSVLVLMIVCSLFGWGVLVATDSTFKNLRGVPYENFLKVFWISVVCLAGIITVYATINGLYAFVDIWTRSFPTPVRPPG